MNSLNRRHWLRSVASLSLGTVATLQTGRAWSRVLSEPGTTDSLPMQLYKSLSDEQRSVVCLPADHPRRKFVSNWWYIHPEHRIPSTFNAEQQQLIKQIFDSLHSETHQAAINEQVLLDQYGEEKNAPAAGSSEPLATLILNLSSLGIM